MLCKWVQYYCVYQVYYFRGLPGILAIHWFVVRCSHVISGYCHANLIMYKHYSLLTTSIQNNYRQLGRLWTAGRTNFLYGNNTEMLKNCSKSPRSPKLPRLMVCKVFSNLLYLKFTRDCSGALQYFVQDGWTALVIPVKKTKSHMLKVFDC